MFIRGQESPVQTEELLLIQPNRPQVQPDWMAPFDSKAFRRLLSNAQSAAPPVVAWWSSSGATSSLVKFPTLNYLGNAENPYPHIHVDVIQDLAMSHCGVPHAEVDQTLLLAKDLTDGGGAEQQHFSHGAHW
jgi:hypothetical protein